MDRRLAIVVSTGDHRDFLAAYELAFAAAERDVEVSMFFMDAGVGLLPTFRVHVLALHHRECRLVACSNSAHALGLDEMDTRVLHGSQDDHAAMIQKAHRTVAFT